MGAQDYPASNSLNAPITDRNVRSLLHMSLAEDVGTGDLTSRLCVPGALQAVGRIVAREPLQVSGVALVQPLLDELAGLGEAGLGAADVKLDVGVRDGDAAGTGDTLCTLRGPARVILTAERPCLNFIGHLSGIATKTRRYVAIVRDAGSNARLLDTRKTTPGFRALEKYAVRCGGGSNHRLGLFDAVLIKDNHVIAAGGIAPAVRAALAGADAGVEVEVECDTLYQVAEAMDAGARAVLLDNFQPAEVTRAVELVAGRARVEVSGGIDADTIGRYALPGVDDISVGKLTHSAYSADLSMEIELGL